jgi:hypothetical protein
VEGVGSQGVLLQLIVIQQKRPVHPAHRQINICKVKELPPAKNISAAVRRLLQSINVANQRPKFWSKI